MSQTKEAVHPLILVSKTGFHDVKKLTECHKFETVMTCDGFDNVPGKIVTHHFYTHDFILPN